MYIRWKDKGDLRTTAINAQNVETFEPGIEDEEKVILAFFVSGRIQCYKIEPPCFFALLNNDKKFWESTQGQVHAMGCDNSICRANCGGNCTLKGDMNASNV